MNTLVQSSSLHKTEWYEKPESRNQDDGIANHVLLVDVLTQHLIHNLYTLAQADDATNR